MNPRGSACFAQVTAVLPYGLSVARCSADAVPCANAVAKSANPGRWAELPGRNTEPDLVGARVLAMLGRHVIATSSIWDALDMALLDDDVTFPPDELDAVGGQQAVPVVRRSRGGS